MLAIDPLRREIVREMHLRPSPAVDPPARVVQLLALHRPDDLAQVTAFATGLGIDLGADGARRDGSVERSGVMYQWERHAEASTITLLGEAGLGDALEAKAIDIAARFPGQILRAIKIEVTAGDEATAVLRQSYDLDRADTVAGQVGAARFWSNFKLSEEDGFGRLVIQAGESDKRTLGRLIQQLQELGNYRNLALLGLPLVREHDARLAKLERALTAVMEQLKRTGEDQRVLDQLVEIAANVAGLRSETAYRLSATAAYGRIVADRLEALQPRPLPGFITLAEFTNRRLMPALRTCENFTLRLDSLATRLEHATGLLRARVETRLQWQNGEVLKSLSETAHKQLQLQNLVEGLSVFAVSYYAIGLLGYALKALPERLIGDPTHLIGIVVLPVLLLAAVLLRAKRRAHLNTADVNGPLKGHPDA